MVQHQKPTVTIFADASISQSSCGWGGWAIRSDSKSITHAGPLSYTKDSCEAELLALLNMVKHIKSIGYLTEKDTHIILQSDSLSALQFLNSLDITHTTRVRGTTDSRITGKPVNHKYSYILADFKEVLSIHEIAYIRHIKGHQSKSKGRAWINNLCDKQAKAIADQYR